MKYKNCVVFVANRGYALTSSRTALIQRFIASGWTVVIATAADAESHRLCEMGAKHEQVIFNRGGLALRSDYSAFRRLLEIYRRWKPTLIHHFHAKPVILGGLAARRCLGKSVRVVNTITGLGNAFVSGGLSAKLAGWGYRLSVPHSDSTIFQNRDDQNLFLGKSWVTSKQARLIVGSGVDTKHFSASEGQGAETQPKVVVMLGRLLRQKGIPEFVDVAVRIRKRFPTTRFLLAGEEELNHPDAVSTDWLRKQHDIEYVGRLSNVVPLLTEATLLLFPSYYREGVPRVILEAAAMGLPTVGFDVPGVREAVLDEKTGYLVPDRDVDALTERVATLLLDESLRLRMGQAARNLIEESFDIRDIEEQYIGVYRELGLRVD